MWILRLLSDSVSPPSCPILHLLHTLGLHYSADGCDGSLPRGRPDELIHVVERDLMLHDVSGLDHFGTEFFRGGGGIAGVLFLRAAAVVEKIQSAGDRGIRDLMRFILVGEEVVRIYDVVSRGGAKLGRRTGKIETGERQLRAGSLRRERLMLDVDDRRFCL